MTTSRSLLVVGFYLLALHNGVRTAPLELRDPALLRPAYVRDASSLALDVSQAGIRMGASLCAKL